MAQWHRDEEEDEERRPLDLRDRTQAPQDRPFLGAPDQRGEGVAHSTSFNTFSIAERRVRISSRPASRLAIDVAIAASEPATRVARSR